MGKLNPRKLRRPKPAPKKKELSPEQLRSLLAEISKLKPDLQSLVAEFVEAISRRDAKPLPEVAPVLWTDAKRRAEAAGRHYTPNDHLKTVYGSLLDGVSMSRADYRRLDPVGEEALTNWLRKNTLEVDLPSKSVALSRRAPKTADDFIRLGQRFANRKYRSWTP